MAPDRIILLFCALIATPVWAEVDITQMGIQSAHEITDPAIKALRMRMVAGDALTYGELRRLADAGDGLAAFKVAQVLEDAQVADHQDEAVHYYALAARTGRGFAVPRLVAMLTSGKVTLSPAQVQNARDALIAQAKAGNSAAALAMSDMYLNDGPFGRDVAKGLAYLNLSAKGGDAKSAMRLALMYLRGTADVPADRTLARAALKIAAASTDLGTRSMAENLLRTIPEPPPRRPEGLVTVRTVGFTPDVGVADRRLTAPPARPAGLVTQQQAALEPGDTP
jgi:TPR repeat protein